MPQAEQPLPLPADQQAQPDVVMLEANVPASPQLPSAGPANPLTSATSPSRKVLLLQKMVLQLLSHIQWRLSVLEEEQFSLSLQHTLMEALLLACRVQGSALTSASASASSQDIEAALFDLETPALFALVLFKRWVLRSIVHLPLPMPVGLKAQIYTGLPKDFQLPSTQVMGMEQGTALLISSMVPLALQILQCLRPSSSSSEMSKNLRQRLCSAPSPKSFSISDVSSEVVCSKAEWTSVAESNFTSSVLFDLANYHFCFEEYSSAFSCVETLRSIGEGKCSRDVDVHILNGLSQATNVSKCSGASGNVMSSIQDQAKPFYSKVNAELDCVFKQTADAEKAVAANLTVRVKNSQPPNINALAQAASRSAAEGTSDKVKLLFAVASLKGPLQDAPIKRKAVTVAATKATEAKARNPLLRRKHTVSELFRELHPDAILHLVHELSKQSLSPRKLSTRWTLEDGASKALLSSLGKESDVDFIFVLLAKAAQLVRVGDAAALPNAGALLRTVEERCKDRGPVRGVQRHFLVSEVNAIVRGKCGQRGLPPRDKLPAIRSVLQEVLSAGAADAVTDSSTAVGLAALINCGDWDFIAQVNAGGSPLLLQLARLLITTALAASNGDDAKADCRRHCKAISDLLLPMAKQGASWSSSKRSRDSGSKSVEQQRWLWVVGFVESIWHPDVLAVLAAFFVSVYNCVVEDASLALKSDFEALAFPPLPPGSTSGLSAEAVLAILQSMGLRSGFQTAGWTRLMADVNFSIGNHASSVRYYLQTLALCTNYFQKPSPFDAEWENVVVARMIKSLLALGFNCYAVELCQFQSEMDYSTAFKNLEERGSNDAMDAVYESVWDVALLEYAVAMHTKRGELSRKKRALERIGVLEVNANNNSEILKETAWRKKTGFLRALCTQFL
jgi:hypothetical protein